MCVCGAGGGVSWQPSPCGAQRGFWRTQASCLPISWHRLTSTPRKGGAETGGFQLALSQQTVGNPLLPDRGAA